MVEIKDNDFISFYVNAYSYFAYIFGVNKKPLFNELRNWFDNELWKDLVNHVENLFMDYTYDPSEGRKWNVEHDFINNNDLTNIVKFNNLKTIKCTQKQKKLTGVISKTTSWHNMPSLKKIKAMWYRQMIENKRSELTLKEIYYND